MKVGSIVASTSHLEYMCRIYGELEVREVPDRSDYAAGQFVTIHLDALGDTSLIGLIADTILINPDYGRYGPRLSTGDELEVFSPDSLRERGVAAVVQILGFNHGPQISHGVPRWTAEVGSAVSTLDRQQRIAFHRDAQGHFVMGYLPRLTELNNPIVSNILLHTLDDLTPAFPDQAALVRLFRSNLAWQTRVAPMINRYG